ncbi:hypothetical protein BJQ94_11830 [Cryobacterium sp. SO2]|uniref:hypothetical protein n=1 Tax=Cryobacterium sp. SO2 TaxID=1897060 RepID=UPI0023DCB33E|nr:hypothetical protein [Cryobacterium sp. SO2]WEO76062.1 hypothetical protein BJQ94_11830 [Cryobacterium sp. SO2]
MSTPSARTDDVSVVDKASPVTKTQARPRTIRTVVTGAVGGIAGVAPHVLHHIGPLVGSALVAGSGGTVLFGVLGFVASVPMLISLRRKFASWWAPGIALAIFVVMFLLSSFVVGPLISAPARQPSTGSSEVGHDSHHP